MPHQITLEEAAGQLSALVRQAQAGEEIVLLDGSHPVARLTSLAGSASGSASDEVSSDDIARLAMTSGAFDWLAAEPDLYDDTCGEALHYAAAGTGS